MNEPKQILAKKIKEARERLGYTQKELAESAAIKHLQTISDIEQSKRDVKAWELANIAKALSVSVADLLSPDELTPLSYVAWREEPQKNKEKTEAGFLEKCRMYAQLEEWLDCGKREELPEFGLDSAEPDFKEARRIADIMSRRLSLGRRPAHALVSVLEEDFGVKIWYENLDDGSAASAFSDDFGFAILMNSKEPPWRRNYNFAHELFHLVTWEATKKAKSNPDYWSNLEKMANAFASDLLLPAEAVINAFECKARDNHIDFSDIVEVAREFEMSTSALLWRLCYLGKLSKSVVEKLLDDPRFIAADKATMVDKWWSPSEKSTRYVRLACLAYKKDKMSQMQLARYLDRSLMEIDELLNAYGFEQWENSEIEITAT